MYDLEKIKGEICGNLYYYDCIDSTNKAALRENAPDKSVFLAKTQENGRGRLGRSWVSDGDGIYMTVLLKPDCPIGHFSELTLVTGLAVSNVLENSKIKWPNDIVIGAKKVSGILVESSISRTPAFAVGIGVNVNNSVFTPEISEKATSIFLETRKKQDKTELTLKILKEFGRLYNIFLQNGFIALKSEYEKKSATLGKDIAVVRNGKTFFGKSTGLTENGELIAEIDGNREVLNSGEVTVRGLLGYC